MLLLFHSDVIIHYSHPAELNQISTLIGTTNSDISYHLRDVYSLISRTTNTVKTKWYNSILPVFYAYNISIKILPTSNYVNHTYYGGWHWNVNINSEKMSSTKFDTSKFNQMFTIMTLFRNILTKCTRMMVSCVITKILLLTISIGIYRRWKLGKATLFFFVVDWMVVWCARLSFLTMTKYTRHNKTQSVLRKVRGLLVSCTNTTDSYMI